MKKIFLIISCLIAVSAFSQTYKPKKGGGLYSTGKDQIDKGWYFGLGATYMLGYNNEKSDVTYNDTLSNTYNNKYIGDPKGKFGLFAEVGLFRMNDRKVINYMDYGLAYKWFRGGENYTNEFYQNNTLLTTTTAEGSYGDHLVSGHFNLGHRYDNSEKTFIVNGLGLNLDYAIIKGRTPTPAIPEIDFKDGPNDILGELHYFFGMGFKTKGRLIIMPIIETPILALYPFNHIVSTHPYFNTRARPIILRVRFMFLKQGSKSCPKVFNPMGIDPNGNSVK
ncbi:MAG: hypothetical protein J5I47_01005 [Vicingus serpentipes]|nr:hypothetical protein [Vicingus serpentipes]